MSPPICSTNSAFILCSPVSVALRSAHMALFRTRRVHIHQRILADPKGGKHAIRHRHLIGILWSQLHIFYHVALVLVLFATGLGQAIHDISLSNSAVSVADHMHTVGNAASTTATDAALFHFGDNKRCWFSIGWGMSIILSGLIGFLHIHGPRAATNPYRLAVRCAVVIPVTWECQ